MPIISELDTTVTEQQSQQNPFESFSEKRKKVAQPFSNTQMNQPQPDLRNQAVESTVVNVTPTKMSKNARKRGKLAKGVPLLVEQTVPNQSDEISLSNHKSSPKAGVPRD